MQTMIRIKDKKLEDDIKEFNDKHYRHMTLTKLFIHALVELMKREEK